MAWLERTPMPGLSRTPKRMGSRSGPDLNGLGPVRIFPVLVDNTIIFHEQKVDYDLGSYDCIKSHKFRIDMIIRMHRFLLSKPNHDSKTRSTPQ